MNYCIYFKSDIKSLRLYESSYLYLYVCLFVCFDFCFLVMLHLYTSPGCFLENASLLFYL